MTSALLGWFSNFDLNFSNRKESRTGGLGGLPPDGKNLERGVRGACPPRRKKWGVRGVSPRQTLSQQSFIFFWQFFGEWVRPYNLKTHPFHNHENWLPWHLLFIFVMICSTEDVQEGHLPISRGIFQKFLPRIEKTYMSRNPNWDSNMSRNINPRQICFYSSIYWRIIEFTNILRNTSKYIAEKYVDILEVPFLA